MAANPHHCWKKLPVSISTSFVNNHCKYHPKRVHGSKLFFQAGKYLADISDGGESGINERNFMLNSSLNGYGAEQNPTQEEEYEDDDYAMSIPQPLRSSEYILDEKMGSNIMFREVNGDVTIHPNEEPQGDADGLLLDASTIYGDDVKESKFDALATSTSSANTTISGVASEEVNQNIKSSKKKDPAKTNNEDNDPNIAPGPIKYLIQNILGGEKIRQASEVKERERKWREWMRSGRKSRNKDVSSGNALDELLSVDKGADYVVVAVPAEAAAGVGPILPSFPGGKRFQKTVGKTLMQSQDVVVNNGEFSFGGDSKNSTYVPRSATISLKPNDKKKTKKDLPRTKKRLTLPIESKQQQQDLKAQERNWRQQELFRQRQHQLFVKRDPGRISANDWRHNMFNMPYSTILRDVRGPMTWVFLWASLWSVVHKVSMKSASGGLLSSHKWMNTASWLVGHMTLPTVQHTMMVSAMSFLLVFRTNSAYQRFAEGRKIWNDIVDTARDFSRMIKLYERALGASKCRRINNLLASFPYLLRHRIRPSLMSGMFSVNNANVERDREHSLLLYPDQSLRDTDPEVAALAYEEEETGLSRRRPRELCWVDKRTLPWKLIPGSALELCARAQNRPLWVCDRMAKELAVVEDMAPNFTNRERLALIGYVDKLSRSIGACERIHQTVVPMNYARHALRSLTVWLWTLPFALVKDLGLLTGPVVAILSWILYGVYEIGKFNSVVVDAAICFSQGFCLLTGPKFSHTKQAPESRIHFRGLCD